MQSKQRCEVCGKAKTWEAWEGRTFLKFVVSQVHAVVCNKDAGHGWVINNLTCQPLELRLRDLSVS